MYRLLLTDLSNNDIWQLNNIWQQIAREYTSDIIWVQEYKNEE